MPLLLCLSHASACLVSDILSHLDSCPWLPPAFIDHSLEMGSRHYRSHQTRTGLSRLHHSYFRDKGL